MVTNIVKTLAPTLVIFAITVALVIAFPPIVFFFIAMTLMKDSK